MKSIALNDNTYWDATGVYDSTSHKTQRELNEQNDSAIAAKYTKPPTGIPKDHLSQSVISSLDKADSALQNHQSLSAYRTSAAQDVIDAGKLSASSKGVAGGVAELDANGKVPVAQCPIEEDVAHATTDWLDEHIAQETGYVIDNTLAVSGAAADAKKTGDELNGLKSALTNEINTAKPEYIETAGVITTKALYNSSVIGQTIATTTSNSWRGAYVDNNGENAYEVTFYVPGDNNERALINLCDANDIVLERFPYKSSSAYMETRTVYCDNTVKRIYISGYYRSAYQPTVFIKNKITAEQVKQISSDVNDLLYTVQPYYSWASALYGGTVGSVYTTTLSTGWRGYTIPNNSANQYKITLCLPSDGVVRPLILLCDANGIILETVNIASSSTRKESFYVDCDSTVAFILASGKYDSNVQPTIDVKRKYLPQSNNVLSRGQIILPSVIEVASGRQCNLYWSAIANVEDGDTSVYFETVADIGINTQRSFVIDATDDMIGTHTITIVARDSYTREILSRYDGSIVVVSATSGSGSKNLMMIGDSRTWQSTNGIQGTSYDSGSNKTITTTVKNLLDNNAGATFTCVGTEVSSADSSVKNCAKSGWTIADVSTFLSNAGGIVSYVEDDCGMGSGASLDYVTIMLGVNNILNFRKNVIDQYSDRFSSIESAIIQMKTLVDTVLNGYPSCKVVIVLESTTCASQDGFGYFVPEIGNRNSENEGEILLKYFRNRIIEEFDNGKYSASVYLSSSGAWADRLYGFPYIMEKPATRISVIEVPRFLNNVHLHDDGYKQIADGIFSTIKYIESL